MLFMWLMGFNVAYTIALHFIDASRTRYRLAIWFL